MMARKWFELKPFQTDSDSASVENLDRIIDHLDKMLLVIYRDAEGTVRIYVRTDDSYSAVLTTLEGIEAVATQDNLGPDMGGLHYTKYAMKHHCANPISPKTMVSASIYRIITKTSGRAFLAVYLRRTQTPMQIKQYISMLDAGQNPESMFHGVLTGPHGIFGGAAGKKTALKMQKMALAREKIATRNLFMCRIITGVSTKRDEKTLRSVFPTGALAGKGMGEKGLETTISGNISQPFFGGNRSVILNDEELHSFLSMPSNRDIDTVEFEQGRMPSSSSGLVEGTVPLPGTVGVGEPPAEPVMQKKKPAGGLFGFLRKRTAEDVPILQESSEISCRLVGEEGKEASGDNISEQKNYDEDPVGADENVSGHGSLQAGSGDSILAEQEAADTMSAASQDADKETPLEEPGPPASQDADKETPLEEPGPPASQDADKETPLEEPGPPASQDAVDADSGAGVTFADCMMVVGEEEEKKEDARNSDAETKAVIIRISGQDTHEFVASIIMTAKKYRVSLRCDQ